MRRALPLLLGATLALGCSPPAPQPAPSGTAPQVPPAPARQASLPAGFEARPAIPVDRVVDGDTVVLRGGERVRVLGIDTPEMRGDTALERELARDAQAELKRLLGGGRVVPVGRPGRRDTHGRTLAYLHAPAADGPGEDLGARLIETGYARIYPSDHPKLASYLALQEQARRKERGVWTTEGMAALGLGFEVEIDAVHAASEVGKRARVVGEIVKTHRSEGALYLNFGRDHRRDFTAVVVKTQWPLFPDDAEDRWLGRRAAVTGKIEERRGRPEIRLYGPDQIELLSP